MVSFHKKQKNAIFFNKFAKNIETCQKLTYNN